MEMGELRAFCLLADTLNFTRTAEALFVSQSTLSRQISRLEEELGTQLFSRARREVELTACGRVFLEDARRQLAAWEETCRHITQAQAGTRGSLCIGYLRDSAHQAFPVMVRQLRQQYPDIFLTFREYGMTELAQGLLQRQVDVGFSFSEGLAELEEIASLVLDVYPMCAVVAAVHPLAASETVQMAQLREEPFVIIDPAVSLTGHQSVLARCMRHGFQPVVAAYAGIVPGLFMLVEAGVGIANLPASAARIAPAGVKFLPISDCQEPQTAVLAWRRDNPNPCLQQFLSMQCSELQAVPQAEA